MLLRPMRPSSSAVGIRPFPDLSILVLQDDNYHSRCVRCTRATGLWIAYLYLYRLKEMYSVIPPIQGSSKLNRCIPDRGAENGGKALRLVNQHSCNGSYDSSSLLVEFILLLIWSAWYLPHPVVLLRTHQSSK